MVIQSITDEQARDYLIAHLGDQDGGKLYNGLNERLRELARIPLLLWMIKEAGLANKKSPGNRGELFELFVNQMLTRDEKLEFKLPWRTKRRALVHLAFTLQQERGQLVCTKDRAREIVTQDMKDYGPEMIELILRESLGHGLLQGDEQQVRFLHQSVQEYFVGLALSKEIQDYNQLPLWKKLVTRSPSSKLATWAKEEWWAESIVQMAGLTEDPSWLAQELVQVQPWLAFWCSIDGKPIDEKTQLIVKAKTVDLLHSEDTEQRRKAVEELRRIKNPRTIKYLIKVLDDEDENVRNITTQALAELGEAAVEPLLESLVSNENGHQAAIRALGQIWGLIDLIKLGGSNQKDQAGAARALGELKDKRIVEPLIATLKDSDEEVRLEVVKALGNLRDSRAVESLITVLKNHDKEVRSRAAEALGEQRNIQALEPLIAALKDTYKEVRASAAEALGKLEDERAAEFLIAVLSDTDENVRQMTILGLGYIWHLSDLIQLGNNDSKIRLRAAEVLGELGDKRVVEPLIATLKDSNELVRAAAVKALGKLRDVRVIEPLIATLDDPNQQVRLIVTGVLRNMGEVESHINNLKSPEWYVRLEAVEVLGKLGDPQAVESIIITLRDNDELVRAAAVEALGKLRDARAIEPLIAILKDQDEGIRRRVVEALVKLGDATVEPLIATLDDNIWYVRFGVIEVLEELKDTRAIKPLTTLLLGSFLWGWGKDREPRVRWVAARALGNFNDEQVVKALKNACKDSDQRVRVESIAALRRIGTPEALAAVQEYEAREK
jgi:HEAT repeat protein